jgi:hypothetical protein
MNTQTKRKIMKVIRTAGIVGAWVAVPAAALSLLYVSPDTSATGNQVVLPAIGLKFSEMMKGVGVLNILCGALIGCSEAKQANSEVAFKHRCEDSRAAIEAGLWKKINSTHYYGRIKTPMMCQT